MKNLTIADIERYDELLTEANKIGSQIEDKIGEIINAIHEVYGLKLDCWYVYGAEEGEVGDILDVVDANDIKEEFIDTSMLVVESEGHIKDDYDSCECMALFQCNGKNYFASLLEEFPTRWLFMQQNDIKKEIEDARSAYRTHHDNEKKIKKSVAEKRKELKKKLIEQIDAKLTPEERKFMKSKLK